MAARKQAKPKQQFVLDALERYERPLTSYAMRMFGGNLHAARDVVQHTFMQLCKQPQAKVAKKLAPWLYTVCRNRALDEIKNQSNRTRTFSDADLNSISTGARDPAEQAESDDLLRSLKQQFDCLSDPEREVIELWSRGLGTADIADVLNKKPGTVRVSLHRAIKRLKEQPEIQNWLDNQWPERATGQIDRRDVFGKPIVSSCNTVKPSIISEQS